jgi:hypothetical protein
MSHVASKTALSLAMSFYLFQFNISVRFRPFILRWVGFLKSFNDFLDFLMLALMLIS